jgi:O-antigen/teichoic acid export membrane protein
LKAKKILQFSIGPFGAALLNLFTLPVVAWIFSPADVGRLNMLQVILGLGTAVFSLAMHQAYVREFHETSNKSVLLKTAIYPGFIFLIIYLASSEFFALDITGLLFGIESYELMQLLNVSIFIGFVINFLAHVLRMQERGLAFSLSQIMPRLSVLVILIIFLSLGAQDNFQNLMRIYTSSFFLTVLVLLWITRESWKSIMSTKLDRELLGRMMRFSLPLVIGGITYWGLTSMDRFFLRALSGFEELAVYSVAAAFASAASIISTIFANLWHPVIYRWAAEGVDISRVEAVVENLTLLIALVWSVAGTFSWVLVLFLPNEYQDVNYILVACLSMPLFYLLAEASGVGVGITRRSFFSLWASASAFLINGILNFLLIPLHGASGAAIASVVAFFIYFIFRTEASSRLWIAIPRGKIYIVVSLYASLSVLTVVFKGNGLIFTVAWISLLIFASFLFLARIKKSLKQCQLIVKGLY